MEQFNLADSVKLIIKDNMLAVFSDKALMTVSSAIFNGGYKQVKAVLNVGVPEGYNDRSLHLDPLELITSSAAKLGLAKDYLAMVTAAKIKNYSLIYLPEQKEPLQEIIDQLTGNETQATIEKELGEYYKYYQYLKEIQKMRGVQARLPFEITIN